MLPFLNPCMQYVHHIEYKYLLNNQRDLCKWRIQGGGGGGGGKIKGKCCCITKTYTSFRFDENINTYKKIKIN